MDQLHTRPGELPEQVSSHQVNTGINSLRQRAVDGTFQRVGRFVQQVQREPQFAGSNETVTVLQRLVTVLILDSFC